MTDNRPADEFTKAMDAALRPVAEREIANATRPYKRLVLWLAVGYGVLLTLSIVQALLALR